MIRKAGEHNCVESVPANARLKKSDKYLFRENPPIPHDPERAPVPQPKPKKKAKAKGAKAAESQQAKPAVPSTGKLLVRISFGFRIFRI